MRAQDHIQVFRRSGAPHFRLHALRQREPGPSARAGAGLLLFCTSALLFFSASCSFSPETTGSLVDCSNGKPCPEGWFCPSTEPKVCVQGALGGDEPGVTDTGTDLHKDGGPSDAAGQTDGGKPPEDAGDDAGSSETGVAGDFGWFDVGSYDGGPCGACDTPPQDVCLDNRHSRAYDRQGSCGAGDTCVYTSTDKECYYGCNNGLCIECTPDCAGKECGDNGCGEACGMCDKAPADTCLSGTTVRDYDLTGTCTAGKCDYRYTDRVCQYGCAGGQCKGCQASCGGKECGDDGCGGSCGTCNSPPGNSCVTTSTLRKYDAAGTCGGSSCNYGYTDQNCPYGCASNKCNPCPPSCAGKDCGDDGCGGSCGGCGGNYTCQGTTCVWTGETFEAESGAMGHNIGRREAEGWSANTADDAKGYLLYGPYATDIPTGARTVSFRMMVDNNTADNNIVVRLEVNDHSGGDTILASRDVRRQEWSGAWVYQDHDLSFNNTTAGHQLEFRVYWQDISYVRIDKVIVR